MLQSFAIYTQFASTVKPHTYIDRNVRLCIVSCQFSIISYWEREACMREHKNRIIQNRNNNSTYNVVNTKFPSIRRPGDGVTEGDEYRMHPSCMEGIAKFMTVSFTA